MASFLQLNNNLKKRTDIGNFGDKVNTNGFDKNPENINRKGQPVSIRNQLKRLLEQEGKITIPANQVHEVKDDGSVVLILPTQDQLAMKLISWALSKKGVDSIKAIQMVMEQIDGKPKQELDVNTKEPIRFITPETDD